MLSPLKLTVIKMFSLGQTKPADSHFPEKPGSSAHVKSSSSVSYKKPTAEVEYSFLPPSVKKAHPKEPSSSYVSEKSSSLSVEKHRFSLSSEKLSSKPKRPNAPTEHRAKQETSSSPPSEIKHLLFKEPF